MADHEAEPQSFGKIIQNPATRRWAYGVGAAVIVVLQVHNLITPEEADAWTNVVSAVVGLATAGLAIPNTPKPDNSEPLG